MKTKLLSFASMLAAFNLNAIEIGPTGSGATLGGFADYSVSSQGGTTSPVQTVEVELNLDFSTGPVAFSFDADFEGGPDGNGLFNGQSGTSLEEAVVTYTLNDNLSTSVGLMLSYLGFEAYDAPNMYQFSYGYDYAKTMADDPNAPGNDVYDAYTTGVSLDYASDDFSIGIWTDIGEKPSWEYAFAYTGIENFTAKAIFGDYGGDADEIMTLWASYQFGNLLLGAEYIEDDKLKDSNLAGGDVYLDDDIEGFLIMGNYALSDSAALTLRYSLAEYTDNTPGATAVEVTKFTISPSYVFTDDLAGLIEYSTYDVTAGSPEPDDLVAFELIYTF